MKLRFSALFTASLLAFSVTGAAVASEYEDVHKCDKYAAHPNDPNRWAAGVADADIIPGPAIKYCRDAVKGYKTTPRFQFQLGRALWAARKMKEGIAVFQSLEEEFEYGPVYAYLGDAYMHGVGGIKVDEELAVSLYQIADEAGFSPASEVLAALSGSSADSSSGGIDQMQPASQQKANTTSNTLTAKTQAATVQPKTPFDAAKPVVRKERPFDTTIYFEKGIMAALYHGNLSAVRLGNTKYIKTDKSFYYFAGFMKPFSENLNFRDESCVYLSNPTLVRIINTKILAGAPGIGGMMVGNGRSLEQNLNAGGALGWQMMGDMLRGMQNGKGLLGSDIGKAGIQTSLLTQHGEKDSTRLIGQYGCKSETLKRIFANMVAFVTGNGSPIVSREETARQKNIEKENRQRKFRTAAISSCKTKFKKSTFCRCLVKGLGKLSMANDDWFAIGTNFGKLPKLSSKYPTLRKTMSACRKIG